MTTKDLQIGDYIEYRGQIIKVTSLYDKGGSNEVGWSDKEDVWVNADNVKPIPITEELLEKNGFKNGQFFAELYIQGWHVMSDAHNVCMKNERGWDINIQCGFVHQLQHALRLCGINKEIEL